VKILPKPHGGKLINRVLSKTARKKIENDLSEFEKVEIPKDLAADIENISNGVFSPLEGPLSNVDFDSVLHEMRLASDVPWTIPIVMDVSSRTIRDKALKEGDIVILTHRNMPIALLSIEDIYSYDKKEFVKRVFTGAGI